MGREDLLARLIAAIDAGAGGQAQAVVLCGEPGAGKSRLAQEAAAVAAARGFRVLSSTGSPLQRDLHYGVLIDVLRPLVRRGPSGARAALVEGLTGLAPLFDDLGVPTAEALGDPGLERTRLFESVRRLFERAARLESLIPDQRALVDLIAVAGGAISHSQLMSASPTDPLPALQRLLDSGTIVEDVAGSGVAYRLMHPLVTQVAAGLLPEMARRRLHARLAAAVSRDDPTQLGLLAYHMTGAGDEVEADEALEVLRAALAQALDTQAGSAAARHADAALRLARQLGRVEDVPSLLTSAARLLEVLVDQPHGDRALPHCRRHPLG